MHSRSVDPSPHHYSETALKLSPSAVRRHTRAASGVSDHLETKNTAGGAGSNGSSVRQKKVVVLGGSGRVGGSTARSIISLAAMEMDKAGGFAIEVVIAGRDR